MERYFNLDLEASLLEAEGARRIRVRVLNSPAGASHAETVELPADLAQRLRMLEKRNLTLAELIPLGETLGNLLLPPAARSRLEVSLARLDDDERLRIRLRFDSYELADLPWEYANLRQPGTLAGQGGTEGFLALDNNVSLARFEVIGQNMVSLDPIDGTALRLVALFANPLDPRFLPLDLEADRGNLEQVVARIPNLAADYVPNATVDLLQDALTHRAHMFHFAGHGEFKRDTDGSGKGYLALISSTGAAQLFSASNLAMLLKGKGVRLAVLGACHAGRRDGVNAWSGIAPALTNAGIPAVVAMQYTVEDANAITFNRRFYSTLAAGQSIDAAVTAGRQRIWFETDGENRDWGVPVLYLRAEDGVLFPRSDPETGAQPATTAMTSSVGALSSTTAVSSPVSPIGIPGASANPPVGKRALRTALVNNFRVEELETLCADIEERLAENGVQLQVSLDMVGGSMLANKVLNLIEYLDTRGHLHYLVDAAREMKPGVV